MHPILFTIGPLTIYSYGFMVAVGFGFAAYLASRSAHEFGIEKNKVIDLLIWILIGGIIGARAVFIAMHIGYFKQNPAEMLDLSKGGLVWYGSFAGGLAAAYIYLKARKIPVWPALDLLAPYLALGQSIGRIGCFLNGCCYGTYAIGGDLFNDLFPDKSFHRHPTQLYSSAALLIIFIILRRWQRSRYFSGEVFLGYCMLSAGERYITEFIRGDHAWLLYYRLTIFQAVSGIVFFVALAVFVRKWREWKRRFIRSL